MVLVRPMQNRALFLGALVMSALLAGGPVFAQGAHGVGQPAGPAPADATPAQKAARRFPQPVRVGDLIDRQVTEPSNHQGVLGRVAGVVRGSDGTLYLVVRYGGSLGLDTRPIAVPIDATALVGYFLEIVDISEAAVAKLPTFSEAGTAPLKPDDVIRIGLERN